MIDQRKPIKRVTKGWGYEDWIVNCNLYCGKILFFEKGKKCSWHFHKIKDEVFYIQTGKLLVRYGELNDIKKSKKIVISPGDKFHVPPLLLHQMKAIEDTLMFEFSTTHFDSDSFRVLKGD